MSSAKHDAHVDLTMVQDGRRRPATWHEVAELAFTDFGLVLGAGGSTGAAFEAGILLALAVDHGVRLRDASQIVGTSAGSIGASLIGLGFEAADVAATIVESYEHVSAEVAMHGVRFTEDVPQVPSLIRMVRPPSISGTVTAIGLLARRRFTASMLHALRPGRHDLREQLRFLDGAPWPAEPSCVRICAVDQSTGQRVVIGPDDGVALIDAVGASCAVPGVIAPVRIAGRMCVDGGVASPTSADLLAGVGHPELVVIVSPMSGRRARTMAGRTSARFAAGKLAAELRRFHPSQRVLVIEPAATLSELVVDDAMSTAHSRTILSSAFVSASAPSS